MASKADDVEMKDADKQQVEEDPEVKKRRVAKEAFALLVSDFISNISILQRGVLQQDDRLISRAIRQTFQLRKKYSKRLLDNVVNKVLTSENERKLIIQGFLSLVKADESGNEMDVEEPITSLPSPAVPLIGAADDVATTASTAASEADQAAKLKQKQLAQLSATEVEVLIQLVITVLLIDKKQISEAVKCSTDLLNHVAQFNRRTLNALGARVYFYYSRSYELNKEFSGTRALLLNALRNASLRHDTHGQSMLVNLLLRNYINDNLYDQANKLLSKTPALDFRSNSQHARFFYYKGRIKSIQLDYSDAYECFMNALRKAPSTTAKGFRTSSQKFAIIVKLLMGEIPERSIFAQQGLKKALKPYFELTRHVRIGDLAAFRDVVSQYGDVYKKDKTYTLIQRIRQNVIRTGLKKISLSYSRISFVDICEKLHLEKPEDVECIVAKAIKDGIIDATIDHDGGFIQSKETVDVYSTTEPLEQFHKRISYCLKVHNECVQAMRFPPDAYKRVKSELEGADERNIRTEELAEELADEDDEGDF